MGRPKNDYAGYSHPYIVAYGRRIGSSSGYIQDELGRARSRSAPRDAWTCYSDEEPRLARDLDGNNMLRSWLENETGISIDDLAT